MKKLLYTIALAGGVTFLPAVQGMDANEEENQIIREQIAQIRNAQKLEKEKLEAELCSFEPQETIRLLTEKQAMYNDIPWYNMTIDEFIDKCPEALQIEQNVKVLTPHLYTEQLSFADPRKYREYIASLSLAKNILENAGVSKRNLEQKLTADEMDAVLMNASLVGNILLLHMASARRKADQEKKMASPQTPQ